MKLDDYLARIEYQGPVAPTLSCLTEIHRQHLLTIPYEDLDVQLGRALNLDIQRTFEKIVVRRRGGWQVPAREVCRHAQDVFRERRKARYLSSSSSSSAVRSSMAKIASRFRLPGPP